MYDVVQPLLCVSKPRTEMAISAARLDIIIEAYYGCGNGIEKQYCHSR